MFFDIRRNAKVLEKRQEHFEKKAWIVYIIFAVISFIPIITAIVGGTVVNKVGFEDAATQEKFERSSGSGFVLNVLATIAQIISSILAIVIAKFYKPRNQESAFSQF